MKIKQSAILIMICFVVSFFGGFLGSNVKEFYVNTLSVENMSNIKLVPITPSDVQKVNLNLFAKTTSSNFSSIYNKVAPSIVTINNDYTEGYGTGSGIIYSADGYIITNAHVVEDADLISVQLYDGTAYTAKVVARSEMNDLALLKVSAKNLTIAKFASSSTVNIGDDVAAIGTPLGTFTGSLTVGIVSGLNRQIDSKKPINYYIQTDAAINPGNSGGALINSKGEVIGMNTSKITEDQVENIGFAIPSDILNDITQKMINGTISNTSIPPELTYSGGPAKVGITVIDTPSGVYIKDVIPDSAADIAGLQPGDYIIKFGDYNTPTTATVANAKSHYKPGDKVVLVIQNGGHTFNVTLTLK